MKRTAETMRSSGEIKADAEKVHYAMSKGLSVRKGAKESFRRPVYGGTYGKNDNN